ncbi:hypothetical protein [Veillonella parvula]|uniref:hypothetical protein n=1 Tax=Veillonella parvula TaxID=29466 RepID=UPI0039A11D18
MAHLVEFIRPLSANVPLATTLGNHDVYIRLMRDLMYLIMQYHLMGMKYLIAVIIPDFGDVHYVVLDTMLYESNHEDNHDTHHPDCTM